MVSSRGEVESKEADRGCVKYVGESDPPDEDEVGDTTDSVEDVDAVDELRMRLPLAALLESCFFPRGERGVARSRERLLLEEETALLPMLVSIWSR